MCILYITNARKTSNLDLKCNLQPSCVFPIEVPGLHWSLSPWCCMPATYGFSRHTYLSSFIWDVVEFFLISNFSNILKKSLNEQVIVLGIQEGYLKQYCPKDKRVVQILPSSCALGRTRKLNNWGRQPMRDINYMSKLLMNLVKWQD